MEDAEKGFVRRSSSSSEHCPTKPCFLISFNVFVLTIALMAVALATVAYVQSRHHELRCNELEPEIDEIDPNFEEESLRRIEALLDEEEAHSKRIRSAQNDTCCTSALFYNSTKKPTAHIVGPSGWSRPIHPAPIAGFRQSDVVSKNWRCNNPNIWSVERAHVRGGMEFNKITGLLKLPVDGIYFIYSQLQFRINSTKNALLSHRIVACVPEPSNRNRCRFINVDRASYQRIRGGTYLESYTTAVSNIPFSGGQFHGGLFSFPAETKIGILAFYHRNLTYLGEYWQSFMGAFLIDDLE